MTLANRNESEGRGKEASAVEEILLANSSTADTGDFVNVGLTV